MKFATIALASAFVLSSTFAFAHTYHHNYQHKHTRHMANHGATYRGTVGMGRGSSTVGTPAGGWYGPRGGHAPGDTGTYGTDPMGR
jgi:hypothetical protein